MQGEFETFHVFAPGITLIRSLKHQHIYLSNMKNELQDASQFAEVKQILKYQSKGGIRNKKREPPLIV